mgnify:CR=1 FL=1
MKEKKSMFEKLFKEVDLIHELFPIILLIKIFDNNILVFFLEILFNIFLKVSYPVACAKIIHHTL